MPASPSRFSEHPAYQKAILDWIIAADCYEGERAIKDKTTEYLPATSGQISLGLGSNADGSQKTGQQIYDAYLKRASFPSAVRQTVEALLGVALREPWMIELPDSLQYLLETATVKGDSIHDLVARMLRRSLLYGRQGLLTEIDGEQEARPYLCDYRPQQIENWDPEETGGEHGTLRLVVLNESEYELTEDSDSYNWREVERYHVLRLRDGVYTSQMFVDGQEEPEMTPSYMGTTLPKIPFTIIGSVDTTPELDPIPMLPLCQLALTMYRTEADYRQTLFMAGQETLVLIGMQRPEQPNADGDQGDDLIIGAGSVIYIPNPDGDAKFIGANSKGIPELRQAIENDEKRSAQFGLALLTSGAEAEASDTLRTRVGGRIANLTTIVRAAAQGLKRQLDYAAEFVGADPAQVIVTPNLDFIPDKLKVEDLNGLIAAKLAGFPISWESIYNFAKQGGLTELDVEQEIAKIQEEGDTIAPDGSGENEGDDEQDDA